MARELQRELAPFAGRVELKWYNELSFENILKDAANLPPHSAIFWHLMNVDAAGVAHEENAALQQALFCRPTLRFSHTLILFMARQSSAGRCIRYEKEQRGLRRPLFAFSTVRRPGTSKFRHPDLHSRNSTGGKCSAGGSARAICLPAAQIYFREPTVWERYWWQIALIIAVILLQAGLITVLLREHRRRQLAEVQSRQRMAELAHVNRFSTAGELTASIAHEINQPLGAILTNAETAQAILKSPSPDIAELKDIVNDILQDDRRATEVIRRMRSLLKKAPFELKQFDLNEVVQETIRFFSALAVGRKFELVSVITPDALPILGDRIQLQQVILNLVMNGIDAMRDTPSENRIISIRTSRVENFAQLSVSDRGSGIPEDKLKEVFEPFFTSKAEGMGMGLSIARTIIEAHNGVISAKNRDHGGASFRIRLPLCTDGAGPS